MNRLASPAQLRASFVRWALFMVPLVMLLGFISGRVGGSAEDPWFLALEKPDIFPAPALFGVVWPILYFLLGLAVALILAEPDSKTRRNALILFFAQLALNFAWSPIFFAAHAIQPALVLIVVMVGLAALAAGQFRRIRPIAGYLMLPYLLWLCFAASLNSAIGRLNPGAGTSLLG